MKIGITPEEAEAFFFEAMRYGYVSNQPPTRNLLLPSWKIIEYKKRPLKLMDMWHTTPGSEASSGVTMIYYNNILIWVMHYGGSYPEFTIPTLKAALSESYENAVFFGGRGSVYFTSNGMVYRNNPDRYKFLAFSGQETIRDENYAELGYHWYRGAWLLPEFV